MIEFNSISGELIKLEKAEGKAAWRLYSKLLDECLKRDIKLGSIFDDLFNKFKQASKEKKTKELLEEDIPIELIEKLLQAFMVVSSSEEIRDLFIKCVQKGLYGNNRITEDLLNDHPEDYNLIFFACLKENVLPFFLGIKGLMLNLTGSKIL